MICEIELPPIDDVEEALFKHCYPCPRPKIRNQWRGGDHVRPGDEVPMVWLDRGQIVVQGVEWPAESSSFEIGRRSFSRRGLVPVRLAHMASGCDLRPSGLPWHFFGAIWFPHNEWSKEPLHCSLLGVPSGPDVDGVDAFQPVPIRPEFTHKFLLQSGDIRWVLVPSSEGTFIVEREPVTER